MPRPRKPTELKKLENNPGKEKLNLNEPKPMGAPVAPKSLTKEAKAVWDRLVSSMPPGVYTTCDEALLESYCENVVTKRHATKMIAAEGHTAKGSQGQEIISPWVRIRDMADAKVIQIGARLGLDPAARASLDMTKTDGPDEFDGLIN